jgi:hypothetical protein
MFNQATEAGAGEIVLPAPHRLRVQSILQWLRGGNMKWLVRTIQMWGVSQALNFTTRRQRTALIEKPRQGPSRHSSLVSSGCVLAFAAAPAAVFPRRSRFLSATECGPNRTIQRHFDSKPPSCRTVLAALLHLLVMTLQ